MSAAVKPWQVRRAEAQFYNRDAPTRAEHYKDLELADLRAALAAGAAAAPADAESDAMADQLRKLACGTFDSAQQQDAVLRGAANAIDRLSGALAMWKRKAESCPECQAREAGALDTVALRNEIECAIGGWSGVPFDMIARTLDKFLPLPNCGACPGNGEVCAVECKLKAESPAIAHIDARLPRTTTKESK